MNFNKIEYYRNFNNYSINYNLLNNNNLLIKIGEYIKSKIYSAKKCINKFESYESKNCNYFSEISSDNVILIKKSLTNISNTLRNSSFEKELKIFNRIKDMHIYILENSIASDDVFSFLIRTLDLFEEITNYLLNEIPLRILEIGSYSIKNYLNLKKSFTKSIITLLMSLMT